MQWAPGLAGNTMGVDQYLILIKKNQLLIKLRPSCTNIIFLQNYIFIHYLLLSINFQRRFHDENGTDNDDGEYDLNTDDDEDDDDDDDDEDDNDDDDDDDDNDDDNAMLSTSVNL